MNILKTPFFILKNLETLKNILSPSFLKIDYFDGNEK